nr:DUF6191 domain-containing protein [Streptomyces piniterrae]
MVGERGGEGAAAATPRSFRTVDQADSRRAGPQARRTRRCIRSRPSVSGACHIPEQPLRSSEASQLLYDSREGATNKQRPGHRSPAPRRPAFRSEAPWRRRKFGARGATSGAWDELFQPSRQHVQEERERRLVLRDDAESGAPPRSSVDLHTGVAVIRPGGIALAEPRHTSERLGSRAGSSEVGRVRSPQGRQRVLFRLHSGIPGTDPPARFGRWQMFIQAVADRT